ncbi:MAG: hypothetical protein GY758_32270 [Fuerstiella sp.]|nr:hypothetical protein [Fuerstiella sp.]MCP4511430.1 hypothetical protein [Fuerstiella sp.]
MSVNVCRFSDSFVTFRLDFERKPPATVSHQPLYSLNNARIQIECRCLISEKSTGVTQSFVLGASCKTERVGVDRDIWTSPNADFAPIFSHDRFMNIKTFARAGVEVERYPSGSGTQSDRQSGRVEDVFDDVRIDIAEADADVLETASDIVQATLANEPLVGQTTIENDRYSALIEYPVKTMNANERDLIYQTDTGPVLLPDLSLPPDELLSGFQLAFAAYNCPNWIELLVRVPTEISKSASVFHYSSSIRFNCENQILRIGCGEVKHS